MKYLTNLLVTAVILSFMVEVYSYGSSTRGKQCDANVLEECHYLESCVIVSPNVNKTTQHYQGVCTCLPGYVPDDNGNCLREGTIDPEAHTRKSASASSVAAGVLIPLTLLAAVGALIYFGRRHQWWQRLRRVPVRQYDTVLIGSQLDGEDDPPLS